jgi:sugar-specific transcriptional regulator TrmB
MASSGWIVARDAEEEAVELLQNLGLKEYEARCFVALTRLPFGTAKEISDVASVPRTRVYDAVRVLESKGLVEIQHANPQHFRALSVGEATDILADRYAARIDDLDEALHAVEPEDRRNEPLAQDVWSLSGREAVAARTHQLIDEATEECILVVGTENALTEALTERLAAATDRDVDVLVGAVSSATRDQLREHAPSVEVFETELDWLEGPADEPSIGVLAMADRNALLVSSQAAYDDGERTETAVFGSGFTNGLVVIARRLLSRGLLSA